LDLLLNPFSLPDYARRRLRSTLDCQEERALKAVLARVF
jgi:hypothetical protein